MWPITVGKKVGAWLDEVKHQFARSEGVKSETLVHWFLPQEKTLKDVEIGLLENELVYRTQDKKPGAGPISGTNQATRWHDSDHLDVIYSKPLVITISPVMANDERVTKEFAALGEMYEVGNLIGVVPPAKK